jgi:hypothetical protein
VRCESDRSAQALEDSTLVLSEQVCEWPGNARPTRSAEPSSPDTGPESPAGPTFAAFMPHRTLQRDGTVEEGHAERNVVDALHLPTGNKEPLVLSNSSPADSPAKTSPSPEDEPGSPESDPLSSSISHESPQLYSPPVDGWSLRTWTDSFPQTADEISPSFSRRWPSSGFTISPGECSTADTSECPSGGGVYSSLPDVLEAEVPPRFYLSPKAAAGLIRRAAKRGRKLPAPLSAALADLASQHRDDGKTTSRTLSGRSAATGQDQAIGSEPTRQPQGTLWGPSCEEDDSTTQRSEAAISSPLKSEPSGATPATTQTEEPRPKPSLRRLTPLERERLQGFPDGWTIPYGPSLAPSNQDQTDPERPRWATQSPFQSPSGSADASSSTREAA